MGCVNEPYLGATPNIALFLKAFGSGFTFGEAAWAAQPVLSWQTTVIGDPLYRPFGKSPQKLHAELSRAHSPLDEWSYLRLVDLGLVHGGRLAEMSQILENLDATTNSAVLTEKLADLYDAQGKPSSAILTWQNALKLNPSPEQRIRLRLTLAGKLQAQDRNAEAIENYQQLLSESPFYPGHDFIVNTLAELRKKFRARTRRANRKFPWPFFLTRTRTSIIPITRRTCRKLSPARRPPASPKSFPSARTSKAANAPSSLLKISECLCRRRLASDRGVSAPEDLRSALREFAKHPKVVAIGETGLDYHHLPSEKPEFTTADDARYKQKQAEIFRQQMEVAAEFGLNCVIHQRTAWDDTIAQMKPFTGKTRGVFHCFGETVERMRQVFEIGSLVSFTGIVTFKNAQNVRDCVADAPLEKFMLETDCPYLAPVPYRGKRCEPAFVREISEAVAQVKNCSLEELSAATCRTAKEFFPKLS